MCRECAISPLVLCAKASRKNCQEVYYNFKCDLTGTGNRMCQFEQYVIVMRCITRKRTQHCGSCSGYLCGNVSSTSWRVSPSVHCLVWRRITLPATVSWLPIPDGDPCGPPSDVSALCHIRTALLAIHPSRLPVRVHRTSCLSVHVTLGCF